MYEESCMINSLHPIKTHFVVDRALWTRHLGTVVESYCMRISRGKPAKDDHLCDDSKVAVEDRWSSLTSELHLS